MPRGKDSTENFTRLDYLSTASHSRLQSTTLTFAEIAETCQSSNNDIHARLTFVIVNITICSYPIA